MSESPVVLGARALELAEYLAAWFGAYFHQDRDIDGHIWSTAWLLIDDCTDRQLQLLSDGLTEVLALDLREVDLDQWFSLAGIGLYLLGPTEVPTYRSVLQWFRSEADAELRHRTGPPSAASVPYRPLAPTWMYGSLPANGFPGRDRQSRILTHAAGAIDFHIAAEGADRAEQRIDDDQWWLCLRGSMTVLADGERVHMSPQKFFVAPSGTRVEITEVTADSRWVVVHLTPDPNGPPAAPHPGAQL